MTNRQVKSFAAPSFAAPMPRSNPLHEMTDFMETMLDGEPEEHDFHHMRSAVPSDVYNDEGTQNDTDRFQDRHFRF